MERNPLPLRYLLVAALLVGAGFLAGPGPRLGTDKDLGGTFQGFGRTGQMDCIDESVNTTTYLSILAQSGMLRCHRVEGRVTRGFFIFGWPHTTAVMQDVMHHRLYAVDSWFEDNGIPPYIVPLEVWRNGWRPNRSRRSWLPALRLARASGT